MNGYDSVRLNSFLQMKKLKIYVGYALKHASLEFKQRIALFKEQLPKHLNCEILEFVTNIDSTPKEVYENDIEGCVRECHLMVADVTHPSLGLGYEAGTIIEKYNKPILFLAESGASVSKIILGTKNAELYSYESIDEMVLAVTSFIERHDIRPVSRGKLIVIEGIDGSGKTTQQGLLMERLEKEGKRVESLHFPRHGQKFFGVMVDEYLTGKFGHASTVNPYLASVLYAGDRWEAKSQIEQWLNDGVYVILDRYDTSNKGHQVGKLKTEEEKLACLAWLDELEYKTFKIPIPDKVIYLDLPLEKNLELIEKRGNKGKEYSKGGVDQHENREHLSNAQSAYRFVVNQYSYWQQIDCAPEGILRTVEDIHEEIYTAVVEKVYI